MKPKSCWRASPITRIRTDRWQGQIQVTVTEWNQFRAIDFERLRELNKTPTLVDLRNVYGRDDMIPGIVKYVGIGRG